MKLASTIVNYADVRLAQAEKDAAKRGCKIVLPKPNELFIDIDNNSQLAQFWVGLEFLRRTHTEIPVMCWKRCPSPSGGEHEHIYVALPFDVTPERRILLQMMLGSDPIREALSYQRLILGDATPTLFFEKEIEK